MTTNFKRLCIGCEDQLLLLKLADRVYYEINPLILEMAAITKTFGMRTQSVAICWPYTILFNILVNSSISYRKGTVMITNPLSQMMYRWHHAENITVIMKSSHHHIFFSTFSSKKCRTIINNSQYVLWYIASYANQWHKPSVTSSVHEKQKCWANEVRSYW